MVLRPVLWLGLAYITGEALNLLDLGAGWFLCLVLLLEILTLLNFTGRLPMKKYSRDVWLLVLPVFICAGFYNCRQAMEKAMAIDAALIASVERGTTGQNTDAARQSSSAVDQGDGAASQGSSTARGDFGEWLLSGRVASVEEKANSWYLYVSGCKAEYGALPAGRLLVVVSKSGNDMDAAVGDTISFTGTPEVFSHPTNEGMFDEWLYYKAKKVQARVFTDVLTVTERGGNLLARWAQQLRLLVKKNCTDWLSQSSSAVAVSMITGDKSDLDADLKTLYQQSGIAHILAISGLHISFLGMGTYNFFRRLRLPLKVCMAAGLVLTVSYGWFTGLAPSTMRAVIMTSMAIIAKALGYTYDRKTAIGIAALVILIPSPLMVTQPGFLLSFIAVGSLALCGELLKNLQGSALRVCRLAGCTLAPGLCVTMGTMPVIAWSFYEIPIYGVLLNLIVIPLMSIVYPAMLVCGFLGGVLKVAGLPVYWLIDGILWLYEKLCQMTLCLPGSVVITGQPAIGEVFFIYILLGGLLLFYHWMFCRKAGGYKVADMLLWLASFMVVGILFLPRRPSMMTVTMVDVGQGDCFFIQLPSGENILADGGSSDIKNAGKYRLIPFLKARGVRRLDAVFLSHMDMDHINAVEELFQAAIGENGGSVASGGLHGGRTAPGAIAINRVLFADIAAYPQAAGANYKDCLSLARQAARHCNIIKTGESLNYSGLIITAVNPPASAADDTNDSSLVLYLTYKNFTMLLTGDISDRIDPAILQNLKSINAFQCTVLKVAHHGSKTSTSPALLDALNPGLALISCGKENRYGHPHRELIKRLEERNIKFCITSDTGEIIVQTDGKNIKTVVWR